MIIILADYHMQVYKNIEGRRCPAVRIIRDPKTIGSWMRLWKLYLLHGKLEKYAILCIIS